MTQAPLPYQTHSATSAEAAVRKGPSASIDRERVLLFLRERGEIGATDEQIQNHLGMAGDTERPRRVELLRAGLVKPEGVRKTRTGRDATVWVVVNKENGDALPGIGDVPALHGG